MVYSFFRNKLGQIYLGWEMSARRSKENVFWGLFFGKLWYSKGKTL